MKLNYQKEVEKLLANLNITTLVRSLKSLNASGREIILKGLSEQLDNNKKQLLISQLRASVTKTDIEIKDWIVQSMSKSYVAGMNLGVTSLALQGIKVKGLGKINVELLLNSAEFSPHLSAVNAMIQDTYLDFATSMSQFTRSGEKILNDALKRQIRSTLISGRLEGESVATIKKTIKETLADKGFIALTDKAGHTWSLDRYGEMLARTNLIKANNEGAINRATDFGIDIVEVTTIGSDDAVCSAQEGQIYSISGKSKNYPPLAGNEPPFHPNCRHSLMYRPDLE